MNRNNWFFTMEYGIFPVYIYINIPFKDNSFESVLKLYETIFRVGEKFKLFQLLPNDVKQEYEIIDSANLYYEGMLESFSKIKENNFIRFFDLKAWSFYNEKIISKGKEMNIKLFDLTCYDENGILEERKYSAKDFELLVRTIPANENFSIENYTEEMWGYPLDIGDAVIKPTDFKLHTDKSMSIVLRSFFDIWFEEVMGYGYADENKDNYDNRSVAYRNTPRLNSFLRDVKKEVLKLGGEWKMGSDYPKYVTEEGVLLDGHIVYQEDIESGRVKLPPV